MKTPASLCANKSRWSPSTAEVLLLPLAILSGWLLGCATAKGPGPEASTAAKGWEQVPALAEILPGFEMVGWFGLVAPTGTPQPVIARVNDELNKLLADREVAERILTIGPMVEAGGSPDHFGGFLRDEHQRWGQVAKEVGLLPE